MTREERLEQALSDVLDIIDSKESRSANFMAAVRGMGCDPEISKRNGEIIEQAYILIGKERPKFSG